MDQETRGEIVERFNVRERGRGKRAMLFAHGFGCDQQMWRMVTPAFEEDYRVVVFDYLGHGGSDRDVYDPAKYGSLEAYAEDLLKVCEAVDVKDAIFVGHSVSAMIGLLASIREPKRFSKLVLICPSPCYLNDGDYAGGFTKEQLEELLDFLDSNHLGWSSQMAPVIMGAPDRPELGTELETSFCRTDPQVARQFARVTFLSDNREDLPKVGVASLIIQCSGDVIAPEGVGSFVHEKLANSRLVTLETTGHCPHVSAPLETVAAIRDFLGD